MLVATKLREKPPRVSFSLVVCVELENKEGFAFISSRVHIVPATTVGEVKSFLPRHQSIGFKLYSPAKSNRILQKSTVVHG